MNIFISTEKSKKMRENGMRDVIYGWEGKRGVDGVGLDARAWETWGFL